MTDKGQADQDGNIPLTCTGVVWASGNDFSVGKGGQLKGQLGVKVTLDEGKISETSPSFDVTGLPHGCGLLPAGDTVVGDNPPPAGDKLACARLALAIKSGNTTKFLGELGFELINKDPGPVRSGTHRGGAGELRQRAGQRADGSGVPPAGTAPAAPRHRRPAARRGRVGHS